MIEYGLMDMSDATWLGDSDGPWKSEDRQKARIAAAVASEQLRKRIISRPIEPEPFHLKDEIPTFMTPLEAIRKLEGFSDNS